MAGVVVGVCIWAGEPYPMFRPPQCQVLTATSVPVRCNMVIGLEDVGVGPGQGREGGGREQRGDGAGGQIQQRSNNTQEKTAIFGTRTRRREV